MLSACRFSSPNASALRRPYSWPPPVRPPAAEDGCPGAMSGCRIADRLAAGMPPEAAGLPEGRDGRMVAELLAREEFRALVAAAEEQLAVLARVPPAAAGDHGAPGDRAGAGLDDAGAALFVLEEEARRPRSQRHPGRQRLRSRKRALASTAAPAPPPADAGTRPGRYCYDPLRRMMHRGAARAAPGHRGRGRAVPCRPAGRRPGTPGSAHRRRRHPGRRPARAGIEAISGHPGSAVPRARAGHAPPRHFLARRRARAVRTCPGQPAPPYAGAVAAPTQPSRRSHHLQRSRSAATRRPIRTAGRWLACAWHGPIRRGRVRVSPPKLGRPADRNANRRVSVEERHP